MKTLIFYVLTLVMALSTLTTSLQARDNAAIDPEVIAVKKEMGKSGDKAPLYSLLASKQGNLTEILTVCNQFEASQSPYCLKKASQQNPEIRTELCDELARRLNGLLPQKSAAGHDEDCRAGIPQFDR